MNESKPNTQTIKKKYKLHNSMHSVKTNFIKLKIKQYI